MVTKTVVVCWLSAILLLMSCGGTMSARDGAVVRASDDETWQEVTTRAGTNVLFGASNTYTIWAMDIGIGYLFRFFFGLGSDGAAVRTDTTVTMGAYGDASQIYACNDEGKLERIAVNSSGTPQNALIRVRYNSTDGYYRLQITEANPPVYVQFVYLSLGGLLCTPGVAGSPLQFASSSSSSDNDGLLHAEPNVLRQVA